MDESIRASTVLNSWMKIEGLIDKDLVIATFQEKSKRTTTVPKSWTDSESSRVVSTGSISSIASSFD
jgi:hypothetical protein